MTKVDLLKRSWPLLVLAVVLVLINLGQAEAAQAGEDTAGPSWVHWIERFFVILTGGVVAFGIVQVEFEFLHWAWGKIWPPGNPVEDLASISSVQETILPVSEVRRFDVHLRIQHFLLLTSFIVLALTGIAQKFYRSTPFDDLLVFVGGLSGLRAIHRVAGFVLILDGLYHMVYLIPGLVTMRSGVPMVRVGRWIEMIPNLRDVQDFFHMMGYFLGVSPHPPRFGHFSYLQKFDYWAVWWGLVIMAASGIVILLPIMGMDVTGTAIIAAALVAHSDEAILAISWIIIVHLFHAHLAPRAFPFNTSIFTSIFTGNISVAHLKEEHPLEFAQLVEEWKSRPSEAQPYRVSPPPGP